MGNPNAKTLTKALGGRWSGNSGSARCPAHRDRTPSLSIKDGDDGSLLTFCFAGCSAREVYTALQDRGLVERKGRRQTPGDRRRERRRPRPEAAEIVDLAPKREAQEDRKQAFALEIWNSSQPATGTLAERYLRGRGHRGLIPPAVRFHPGLRHGPSGQTLPAMVCAAVNSDDVVTGIQRVFLTQDGKKAPVEPVKMSLGPTGGSAVRIGQATDDRHTSIP